MHRPFLSSWTAPRGASPTSDPAFRPDLSAGFRARLWGGSCAPAALFRSFPGPWGLKRIWKFPVPLPSLPGETEAGRSCFWGDILTSFTQTPWPSP